MCQHESAMPRSPLESGFMGGAIRPSASSLPRDAVRGCSNGSCGMSTRSFQSLLPRLESPAAAQSWAGPCGVGAVPLGVMLVCRRAFLGELVGAGGGSGGGAVPSRAGDLRA